MKSLQRFVLAVALMLAGIAHALPPTITYSWVWNKLVPGGFGDGFASLDEALQPGCLYTMSRNGGTAVTACALQGRTEAVLGRNDALVNYSTPAGPWSAAFEIYKFASCPSGEEPYTVAVNELGCRPVFCSQNVGKYTTYTASLGMTPASQQQSPPHAANYCFNACVITDVSGTNFGLSIDGVNQSWYYSGTWKFTGEPCADKPGLGTASNVGPITNSPSTSTGTSTNPTTVTTPYSQTDSTNLSKIANNTDGVKSAINGVKDAVNSAKDAIVSAINSHGSGSGGEPGVGGCGGHNEPACAIDEGDTLAQAGEVSAGAGMGNISDSKGAAISLQEQAKGSSSVFGNALTQVFAPAFPTASCRYAVNVQTVVSGVGPERELAFDYCDYQADIQKVLELFFVGLLFLGLQEIFFTTRERVS